MNNRVGRFATLAISLLTVSLRPSAFSQFRPTLNINCGRSDSLAAVASNAFPNTLINIKGTCAGPINITTSGIQIKAVGIASINGGGKDAVTITGAQRVTLTGLAITGGINGIVAQSGADVLLQNDTVSSNTASGVVALANSGVTVTGGSTQNNGLFGIDVEATSALVVTGSYSIAGNGVFGINVNNGSSLTLTAASLSVTGNTLGIQLGTNASGFVDGQSTLDASRNLSDGITIVSGSHMVDFGGTITAGTNSIHGISLNSKAGLDLDAGSQVNASGNGSDGVHLEQSSVMTIFNNPNFSGNPGITTLTTSGQGGNGVSLLTGSKILVDNYARINSFLNQNSGVVLDDGSSLSFGHTIPIPATAQSSIQANHAASAALTFGSRLTYLPSVTFDSIVCDASSLVRGPGNTTCPH